LIVNGAWTFVDWDMSAPGRRLWDLAWAAYGLIGLTPEFGFDDATNAGRIVVFCHAVGFAASDGRDLLETVVERATFNAVQIRHRAAAGGRALSAPTRQRSRRCVGEGRSPCCWRHRPLAKADRPERVRNTTDGRVLARCSRNRVTGCLVSVAL
jgi:hypothetical protein